MLEMNQLYNMDCMEGMKEFPDGYFDLAIVDPPYGVGSITYTPGKRIKSGGGGFVDKYDVTMAVIDMNQRSSVKSKYLVNVVYSELSKETMRHFGDENVAPPPEYFKELFRVSKNQIVWGGNYFLLPPSRCFVVWDKQNGENFSMGMAEFAWTSFTSNSKIFRMQASGGHTGEVRFHPTQKPKKLYTWLLNLYAKPGDKILDTHVGSASSLIACYDLGFDHIGFELDKDYYDAAQARIAAHRQQTRLFDAVPEESAAVAV